MANREEGIRRLSLAVGIAAGIGLPIALVLTESGPPTSTDLLLLPIASVIVGCAGWGIVRLIWWVISGFTGSSPH